MTNEEKLDFNKVKTYVSKVNIIGLRQTDEAFVKKQMGEIFKSKNFNELLDNTNSFRKKLLQLGCFKSVEALIDSSENKEKDTYQVMIEVEELGRVGGGVHTQVGNNEGSVSSTIFFPNMFGKGEKIACEFTYGSSQNKDARINFTTPLDMDPNKNFSLSLFRSSNDFSWSKYKEINHGTTIDILTPYKYLLKNKYEFVGKHVISYEGIWRHLLSSIDSSFDVREQSGHSLKSSLKYENIIDKRNHNVLPTEGGFLKTTIEAAGLGGDVNFLKFNSDYQYSRTFFKHFTTQFSVSNGLIMPWKSRDKILINDKFFLGGPLTLRGFNNRGAGPHKENCSLGSDAYWLCGAHVYTPLPFLHNNKTLNSFLKTHSFINIGNVFDFNHLKSLNDKRIEYLLNSTRLSIGTGLVLAFGNIARLELNYVWPMWKNKSDKAIEGLQFGIGLHFN